MISAAVGFQCPECVKAGNKGVRGARTTFGGKVVRDTAMVTKVLIAINVVLFVLAQTTGEVVNRLALIGAGVATGEWWRLLTAAFVHQQVLHMVFNMLWVWILGQHLERLLGPGRFLTLYLLSALGGTTASYVIANPAQPSIGASGAVYGLIGAALVVGRRMDLDTRTLFIYLAIFLGLSFVFPNVDWRAHVGGLVTGVAVAVAFAYAPRKRRTEIQAVAAVAIAVLIIAGVLVRTAALTGGA